MCNKTQDCAEAECKFILHKQQQKSEAEEKTRLIDRCMNLKEQLQEQQKITHLKMDRKR